MPLAAGPETRWQPVPPSCGAFAGYWSKDAGASTPLPLPIDDMLGVNWLARRAHESIQGIKVRRRVRERGTHACGHTFATATSDVRGGCWARRTLAQIKDEPTHLEVAAKVKVMGAPFIHREVSS